ncbi:hypothetical protein [Noviherbaspirillum cavernae]|nr:hypothetical protein [Noviherbaspirillum cavernae]
MQAPILMPTTTVADTSKLMRVNDIEVVKTMWVLFLEAGVALFLLVFIVWWTMFSGKKPTHPPQQKSPPPEEKTPRDD